MSQPQVNHIKNFERLQKLLTYQSDTEYLGLTTSLREDIYDAKDNIVWLGMSRAPAAKKMHHAYEGGLVQHMLEMWDLWNNHLRTYFASDPTVPPEVWETITDKRIIRAIINHDLHKAHKTFVLKSLDPWQVEYGDPNHETDLLLGSDVKSFWILNQHNVQIDPIQANAILWAEGGFAKIKTKCYAPLAVITATLDAMSGAVLERLRYNDVLDMKSARRGHQ